MRPSTLRESRPAFTQEIKLYDNNEERKHWDRLADLYATISVTEALETLYSRDAIAPKEYEVACSRLISQFKADETALVGSKKIVSADAFYCEYQMDFPRAYERLFRAGVPATMLHAPRDDRPDHVVVADTVRDFITAMDAIKLDTRAKDQVQPYIVDLLTSLGKMSGLPPDFEGTVKMKLWLQKLNLMSASSELGEEEARQLLFDLESSYGAFSRHLQSAKV